MRDIKQKPGNNNKKKKFHYDKQQSIVTSYGKVLVGLG